MDNLGDINNAVEQEENVQDLRISVNTQPEPDAEPTAQVLATADNPQINEEAIQRIETEMANQIAGAIINFLILL